jgi:hypothetical protein
LRVVGVVNRVERLVSVSMCTGVAWDDSQQQWKLAL